MPSLPSLTPSPYPESLTLNKWHLMEALYGAVPYKASKVPTRLRFVDLAKIAAAFIGRLIGS